MVDELIRLIDEPTAKALKEGAKAAQKAMDLATAAGAYGANILGSIPRDLIGYLIGDRLIHARIRQWNKLSSRTEEILELRGKRKDQIEEASPSVEIPLLEAALDESRDELIELWARLLAAAVDPDRKQFVRRNVIEVAKRLEPLDVLVLDSLHRAPLGANENPLSGLMSRLKSGSDDISLALSTLESAGLLDGVSFGKANFTALGRTLMRAISD
jgi:hypothetical protein